MSNIFCIDLGTCNIKIFNSATKEVLNEKNVIAIVKKKELLAYGEEAYLMHEKAPSTIDVSFPVQYGVIADYKHMQTLLGQFLNKLNKAKIKNADFVVAVPTDVTEVEKKSFHDLVKSSGIKAREILICEKPLADGVGLGLDVKSPTGTLVVDVGAATTEISVLSLGGIVISQLIHVGGNKFDESIISYIKKTHGIDIGLKTACALKEQIGSAIKCETTTMPAFGRDIVTGLPIEIGIESDLIHEAIKDNLMSIVNAIKIILERTPPELSADIINHGVYLTGGSAKLQNLDKLLEQELKVKVNMCDNGSESVVNGLMHIATEPRLKSLSYSLKPRTLI